MRDKRAELLREYEEADGIVKAQMELVETKLLDLCKEIGADTLGSKHGKVMRSVKTRYWTSDWDSMHKFILEHKMPELLEFTRMTGDLVKAIRHCPQPVIAAVDEPPEALTRTVNLRM